LGNSVLINFFQTLKKLEIPVSVKEFLVLLEAMQARLAFGSVDDFYLLARSCLVKDEKYFDRFDRAFSAWFKDLESLEDVLNALVPEEWLRAEFEKYLWIDCDAWINSWDSVELYFKACENGKLGITQTIGAGYRILTRVQWIFGKLAAIKSQNYKHAKKSGFSESTARKIAFAPHLNIGVFSLEKNSPCWKVWQDNLRFALKKGNIFGSEGLAINISVYINNIKTEFLPLKCNWIASNLLPKYEEINETFVEPYLPNNKIGIMHLAAGLWKNNKDMRIDKNVAIDIETLDGNIISKSLRFD